MLNRMVTDNLAKQISSSWLIGDNASYDTDYKLLAGQGQSFFQASGDDGAYYSGIGQWADDTNITLVGGTTLTTTGPGGAWSSETIWNWYSTGQGTAAQRRRNQFQQHSNSKLATGHQHDDQQRLDDAAKCSGRRPDRRQYFPRCGQRHQLLGRRHQRGGAVVGGIYRAHQSTGLTLGRTNVGFLNPAIYTIGKGPNYTADFHDITTGNNTNTTVRQQILRRSRLRFCTGWGTPNGMNLINALATPNSLGILPGTGFTSTGPVGGPFNVTSQIFSLTNSGGTSLNWSLTGIPPWLGVSSVGGTLPASGSTTVTVNLNSTANNLLAGIYTTNLVFTNMTGGVAQSRQFTLQVGQPLVQNGGFETGDFSFWTLNGGGYNYNYVDDGSTVTAITPHSGSYFAALGEVGFSCLSFAKYTDACRSVLSAFVVAGQSQCQSDNSQ